MAKVKRKPKENREDRFTSNGEGVLFFANEAEYLAYKKKLAEKEKSKEGV